MICMDPLFIEGILNQVQDDGVAVIPDPDPGSPRSFRDDKFSVIPDSIRNPLDRSGCYAFPTGKEILNQVQDDGVAVIPDPDPESLQSFRDDLCSPVDKGILNQVQDDELPVIPDSIRNPIDYTEVPYLSDKRKQ